jgi:hypothetical protein
MRARATISNYFCIMQDLIRNVAKQDRRSDQIQNARLISHDPFIVLLYFDANLLALIKLKSKKEIKPRQQTTT